jgi:predicted ATP-dependent protease
LGGDEWKGEYMTIKRIEAGQLRWRPAGKMAKLLERPERIEATEAIVGQERAIDALHLGLKLYRPGFNIYVAGMAGTGRMTTIKRALEQLQPVRERPPDRCYVHNFDNTSEPILLTFDQGKGRAFRDDMKEFIRMLRAEIPKAIESPHVQRERDLITERYQRQEKKLFEEFAENLKKEGFALVQVQEGGYVAPTVFPVVGKEAVSVDFLDNLVKEGKLDANERDLKVRRHKELTAQLKRVLSKARSFGKEMHQAIERLMQRSASTVLDGLMDDLRARYADEKVRKYLLKVKAHILKSIDAFSGKKEHPREGEGLIVLGPTRKEDPFWVYEVNLIFDQLAEGPPPKKGVPIVDENNPTYSNLFGAVEYNIGPGGYWSTDFRHIKAGALVRADGGYLIVNALDLLRRPMVWDQLKRVLKTEKLIIQQPETYFQLAPLMLKPEPIELTVKVIMTGPSWLYHLLYYFEEDFPKTFKVLSDFDTTMALTPDSAKEYASVLKAVGERGKLRPFDRDGLMAMLEHGVIEAGQQDRISTRFSYITDVLREADYWAGQAKAKKIRKEDVERAIEARRERHRLTEAKIQRLIDEGVILISSRGRRVGQVNGLSVFTMGHLSFGKPSRVTASTAVGKAGVINIEREAKLSGPLHDKGVYILTGYLRQKYAQREPLNLTASVCFEQSYGGIDGDSASSTEIYALLSSLSGVPISQELAVTGSVNQLGDVQTIGGVSEKVEGFYDVCKIQGLTGKQGVIIPTQNERHLLLRKEVVEAVQKGKFRIYSISNIDEGIELLTGKKAGQMRKDGTYLSNTIHGMVAVRLKEMAEAMAALGGEGAGVVGVGKPKKARKARKVKKARKAKRLVGKRRKTKKATRRKRRR